jgi:hypothetical protein
VQLDSTKTRYASFGRNPTPWEESQGVQVSAPAPLPAPVSNATRRALVWNETAGLTLVSDFSATTATVIQYGSCVLLGVGPEAVVLDEPTAIALDAQALIQPLTPVRSASRAVSSPIVEMRPAHRSLRDVPREKMSEFERNYPW